MTNPNKLDDWTVDSSAVLVVPYFDTEGEFPPNSDEELVLHPQTRPRNSEGSTVGSLIMGESCVDVREFEQPLPVLKASSGMGEVVDFRLPFFGIEDMREVAEIKGLPPNAADNLMAQFKRFTLPINPRTVIREKPRLPMALYEVPGSAGLQCNVRTLHRMADTYANSFVHQNESGLLIADEELIIGLAERYPYPTPQNCALMPNSELFVDKTELRVTGDQFEAALEYLGLNKSMMQSVYPRMLERRAAELIGPKLKTTFGDWYVRKERQERVLQEYGLSVSSLLRYIDKNPSLRDFASSGTGYGFSRKYPLVKYAQLIRSYGLRRKLR